ncbi:hypothetical protein PCH70_03000 [Pseudomonas cichorii JBC1]|uniref:Oligosaccharide repeat unit polymerase n=3 Tax=Pseudomonas TaxID=286 RepID=A0A3M4W1N3_PSECI|nr:hypothetical protein PCH70_03000 [Pseudomonas cichorii JBC1]RMR57787.1 hypothetical protein ALP84_02583 [Pseudomonas cichorii]
MGWMKTAKFYIPLLLVESYLLFTLWLFFFGPVIWPVENKKEFLFVVSLYHAFFIAGYLLSCRFSLKQPDRAVEPNGDNLFLRYYWIIIVFAFIAMVILHRNTTLSRSYFPTGFFSELLKGLLAPAEVRSFYASAASREGFSGNAYVTGMLLFFGVFKYVLLPGLVFFWDRLSTTRKLVGFLVVMLPLCTGIISSLSAINFYYLFVVSVCLFGVVISNKSAGFFVELGRRKTFLFFLVFIFLFSFWQFYSVKSGVSPYKVFFEDEKPVSFSYLNETGSVFKSDLDPAEKAKGADSPVKDTAPAVPESVDITVRPAKTNVVALPATVDNKEATAKSNTAPLPAKAMTPELPAKIETAALPQIAKVADVPAQVAVAVVPEKSNLTDFYEKLTVYLVQGYQGVSIALGEKFDSSYGIGHSVFLQRVFAEHLGIDVRDRTFQRKITARWDENVYWHSFYSYMANDVGFFGVSIVMLILGWYFANVYLAVVNDDDFFAKMLLPLFAIMFLYIPANNQVFSFLETMISFWILTALYIFHRRRTAVRHAQDFTEVSAAQHV